jgi:hypothetical protein
MLDLVGTLLHQLKEVVSDTSKLHPTNSEYVKPCQIMSVMPRARAQLYCQLDMFADEMTVEHFKSQTLQVLYFLYMHQIISFTF